VATRWHLAIFSVSLLASGATRRKFWRLSSFAAWPVGANLANFASFSAGEATSQRKLCGFSSFCASRVGANLASVASVCCAVGIHSQTLVSMGFYQLIRFW
jgi:hypothetical protein